MLPRIHNSRFMCRPAQDRTMYYPETDQPTNCRTSNLNEELGQVRTCSTSN